LLLSPFPFFFLQDFAKFDQIMFSFYYFVSALLVGIEKFQY